MALWAREVSGAFEKRTPGHSGIGGILAMKTQFALAGKLCKWEYKRTFVFHPIILLEATIAEIGDPTRPTSKSGLTQQSTSTFAWSWACPSPWPLCSKDGERYSDCRRRTGTQIAVKVIPLKLFYYQTFFETWRNEHSWYEHYKNTIKIWGHRACLLVSRLLKWGIFTGCALKVRITFIQN